MCIRDRYALSSTQALQLAMHSQPVPLTKHAASQLLENLERRGWLHLSRTIGAYSLTLRALHELDTYIRTELEDCVLECLTCYAIVTQGERCSTPACRGAVHTSCVDAYRAGHATCTVCGQAWQTVPVGGISTSTRDETTPIPEEPVE